MRSANWIATVVLIAVFGLIASACDSDQGDERQPAAPTGSDTEREQPQDDGDTHARDSEERPDRDAERVTLTIIDSPDGVPGIGRPLVKSIQVRGAVVAGTSAVPDAKLRHAARVLDGYVDNDGDGEPDDPDVPYELDAHRATLLMAGAPNTVDWDALPDQFLDNAISQDLYASETLPEAHGRARDAAIEEVHHLLWNAGWAPLYPAALSDEPGTRIANAMDVARGGRFPTVPDEYPQGAWFTYDDVTCDYACMVTEYAYWVHTSLLGAQAGDDRCDEIRQEWRPCTPALVRATDRDGVDVITNPQWKLPQEPPV